ncbi:hypothetical protein Tco_0247190 [Tanacetum coccineum]
MVHLDKGVSAFKKLSFEAFKKHVLWDLEAKTSVRVAWDAKASGRYADFLRDIRGKKGRKSSFGETTLYIAAASGVKRRNLYGVGSKSVDSIKDIDSRNKTIGITKVNVVWEKNENIDGGDAHQGPNTSHSRAGERNEGDHDSFMIVS